ncbi:leucyl aminopeptidase family protein [Gammaproteobacteria bacterium AB-CW1]|uniref:Leucyl aminopeptidase family protein n=1 Tax=Natronospira elongata TaxID=3110268 RepID=A0AAP6JG01_9GAMM|nr:leucyl aminopeptidase family protein [Gammaproteobacteria bacterium AB-CW1]
MLTESATGTTPIHPVTRDDFETWLEQADADIRDWARASGFEGEAGRHLLVPDGQGGVSSVLVGHEEHERIWALASLPGQLPAGDYHLAGDWSDEEGIRASVGWLLGAYRFDRYKSMPAPQARLTVKPEWRQQAEVLAGAASRVRDLVNTPAIDLGPEELAGALESLAERFNADYYCYEGEELKREFPAVHAVGQAASRGPRLARLSWGNPDHPSLALVGKGVVFDSGGLNIKPGAGMVLMKKDMGGAAHVIGLAEIIMSLGLKVHLRVYVPAVENAIAGNAYRPSDIIRTRNGTTVEIGNTDAEGRVILSDALSLACEEGAERVIDFATLTGAARVALGEDLPPVYGRDQAALRQLQDLSFSEEDPLWHMPLYKPYKRQIQPALADLSNTGTTPQGGSLTAALFLDHFVAADRDWMHLDIYAWNLSDRPGRPAGGEAQGLRAVWAWLRRVYD